MCCFILAGWSCYLICFKCLLLMIITSKWFSLNCTGKWLFLTSFMLLSSNQINVFVTYSEICLWSLGCWCLLHIVILKCQTAECRFCFSFLNNCKPYSCVIMPFTSYMFFVEYDCVKEPESYGRMKMHCNYI